MSFTAAAATAALLASVATSHPAISVTAGPAKTGAAPGAVVLQRVSNHGTGPEHIIISVDEIGRTGTGACSFLGAPPLATVDRSSVDLAPGGHADLHVTVARTARVPGIHDITVAYTVAGTGAVKVTQGVATQLVVKYPGSTAAQDQQACAAVAPAPHHAVPVVPLAAGVGAAGLVAAVVAAWRRRRRARRTAR